MAKVLSLVAYNDLESQVEALERDGYAYFPSVLDACLLYTSPSPRDRTRSRMPSSA